MIEQNMVKNEGKEKKQKSYQNDIDLNYFLDIILLN
jgi:hypothetical protein